MGSRLLPGCVSVLRAGSRNPPVTATPCHPPFFKRRALVRCDCPGWRADETSAPRLSLVPRWSRVPGGGSRYCVGAVPQSAMPPAPLTQGSLRPPGSLRKAGMVPPHQSLPKCKGRWHGVSRDGRIVAPTYGLPLGPRLHPGCVSVLRPASLRAGEIHRSNPADFAWASQNCR